MISFIAVYLETIYRPAEFIVTGLPSSMDTLQYFGKFDCHIWAFTKDKTKSCHAVVT